jgi:hypothetical protein
MHKQLGLGCFFQNMQLRADGIVNTADVPVVIYYRISVLLGLRFSLHLLQGPVSRTFGNRCSRGRGSVICCNNQ